MARFAIGRAGFVVNVVEAATIEDVVVEFDDEIYEDVAGTWNVGDAYTVANTRQIYGGEFVTPIITLNKRGQLVSIAESFPRMFAAALASDQATGANVTPISLPGLVFSYEANKKYRIWFMGDVQPAAATTGCGFQFLLSSAVLAIRIQFSHALTNAGALTGGYSIASDASVGVSSGFPATAAYPITGGGLLATGANAGTAQMRFRSETNAIVTAKAGLTMTVERLP